MVALALVLTSPTVSAETQLRGASSKTDESSSLSLMNMFHRVLQFNIGSNVRQGDVTGLSVTSSSGSTTSVIGGTTTSVISNAMGDEDEEDEGMFRA